MSRTFRRLSGNQYFLEINRKNCNNPLHHRQNVIKKEVPIIKEYPIYGDYFGRTREYVAGHKWVFSHLRDLPTIEEHNERVMLDVDWARKMMRDGVETGKAYRKWFRRKFSRQANRRVLANLYKEILFEDMDYVEEKEPRIWWD